jgi:hypothetical protein
MYVIYLHARFNIHSFNGSLVIHIKDTDNMHMAAKLLFQFLQINLLTEYAYFFILYKRNFIILHNVIQVLL